MATLEEAAAAPQGLKTPKGGRPQDPHRYPLRAPHRMPLGGCAPRVWFPAHLLAETHNMGGGRHLRAPLARPAGSARRSRRAVGQSVLRCQLRPGQKGGACVGKTRRGKHTKITLVTDANGLPVGLELVRGRPVKGGLDYSVRWKVERIFTWVGNFRRLLVRHERYLSTFRAFFLVALIRISMRYF